MDEESDRDGVDDDEDLDDEDAVAPADNPTKRRHRKKMLLPDGTPKWPVPKDLASIGGQPPITKHQLLELRVVLGGGSTSTHRMLVPENATGNAWATILEGKKILKRLLKLIADPQNVLTPKERTEYMREWREVSKQVAEAYRVANAPMPAPLSPTSSAETTTTQTIKDGRVVEQTTVEKVTQQGVLDSSSLASLRAAPIAPVINV